MQTLIRYIPSDNAVLEEKHGLHFATLLQFQHDMVLSILTHNHRLASTRIGAIFSCGTPSTDDLFLVLNKALQQDPNESWARITKKGRRLPQSGQRFISPPLSAPGEEPYLWLAVEGASFRIGVCHPSGLTELDFSLIFTPRSKPLHNFFTDLALGFETAHNLCGHTYATTT